MKDRLITVALSALATLGIIKATPDGPRELEVDRLIVKRELIVSDTGQPWEKGFEAQQIPRGIYARSVTPEAVGGLWVRSRLIKGEIDDPFDDRFHALERQGVIRRAPGHISWNVWADENWRQIAIIQGEGVEPSEVANGDYSGANHPGRLRFQTFRPNHGEPLTDMLLGQGMVSIGGGGYGGGGLPIAQETLTLVGGTLREIPLTAPESPVVLDDDGSGVHEYAIVAVGAQGLRSPASPPAKAKGKARLRWDSIPGADSYIVLRDGKEASGALRIEGAQKAWQDK